MLTYTTPGVFIEEQPATGPITGVGTSTAAFIGPALQGPIGTPTIVTNFSQFTETFGGPIVAPRHYLAYAVRGFFQNGGTRAHIVRVSTAVKASRDLADRTAESDPALTVEARAEGTIGNGISVAVAAANATTTSVAKHSGTIQTISGTRVAVAQADGFRAGDVVMIDGGAGRATIDRVRNADIFLTAPLTGDPGDTLRIADLAVGQTTFRVDDAAGLSAGSVLTLQGDSSEVVTVAALAGALVTLDAPLGNSQSLAGANTVSVTSEEFSLTVTGPGGAAETFANLSMDARHPRYYGRAVNSAHVLVKRPAAPTTAPPPNNQPAVLTASALTGGVNDDLSTLALSHFEAGLDALKTVDDVSMVAMPDRTDPATQGALITHCEQMGDRFAILDSVGPDAPPFGDNSVLQQRADLDSARGHAALYYPWQVIPDPQGGNGATLTVPPSGFVAGIYARSDATRGVHKAPANEIVAGALGVARTLNETELGDLNVEGINVIRTFPNRAQPTVWGARTTAPAAEAPWRYVNVRRLLLFIEESIQEGLRFAVFEPNNPQLWQKLNRTITEFLTRVWRSGALFGATPQEAFYVKVDEELNPPSTRALGQVVVEIGVAPVRPAEFIIVRIGQREGGADVSEN